VNERVQKIMAQANIGSRRTCEELISQGRVRVNGKVIRLGDQADASVDVIEVDGTRLKAAAKKLYIAFNKPKYVISDEPHKDDSRKSVRDYLPFQEHLFSAGRLDADSEGLMVLTNDGELANRLTHPRFRHTKTYKVTVNGLPSQETLDRWRQGIVLVEEDETTFRTAPCYVKVIEGGRDSVLRVVMTEGKKRQIRRVAAALGHPVISLTRTFIGQLGIGALRPGEWRELTPKEIMALKTPAEELKEIPRPRPQRRPYKTNENAEEQPQRPARPASRKPQSGSSEGTRRKPPSRPGERPSKSPKRTPRRRDS
jgi:23S rRNA pseudouridine2605 synthase